MDLQSYGPRAVKIVKSCFLPVNFKSLITYQKIIIFSLQDILIFQRKVFWQKSTVGIDKHPPIVYLPIESKCLSPPAPCCCCSLCHQLSLSPTSKWQWQLVLGWANPSPRLSQKDRMRQYTSNRHCCSSSLEKQHAVIRRRSSCHHSPTLISPLGQHQRLSLPISLLVHHEPSCLLSHLISISRRGQKRGSSEELVRPNELCGGGECQRY